MLDITTSQIESLLKEADRRNPIDFADMACDEDRVRKNIAASLVRQLNEHLTEGFGIDDVVRHYMTQTAYLALENAVLRLRAARHQPSCDDVRALLDSISRS